MEVQAGMVVIKLDLREAKILRQIMGSNSLDRLRKIGLTDQEATINDELFNLLDDIIPKEK